MQLRYCPDLYLGICISGISGMKAERFCAGTLFIERTQMREGPPVVYICKSGGQVFHRCPRTVIYPTNQHLRGKRSANGWINGTAKVRLTPTGHLLRPANDHRCAAFTASKRHRRCISSLRCLIRPGNLRDAGGFLVSRAGLQAL